MLSEIFKKKVKVVILIISELILQRIKFSSKHGKRNIIYDSEGCPGPNGLWLEKVFKKSIDYIKYIDHYLFWGNAQKENINKNFNVPFKTTSVGYLRRYENTKEYKSTKSILINTNFAFVRPKFNLRSKEILEIQKLGFTDINEAKKKFQSSLKEKNFIQTEKVEVKSK